MARWRRHRGDDSSHLRGGFGARAGVCKRTLAAQRLSAPHAPRRPSLEELERFTNIDPERELALIATTREDDRERQIGVARYAKESSPGLAEFAIVLSDDWQRRGLGTKLLLSLIAAAKDQGVRSLVGTALSTSTGILALGRKLGFQLTAEPRSAMVTNLMLDLTR